MHTTINMLKRQKGGAESAKVISSLCSFGLLSQCVFDGGQRFTFVLQVLLQLSEHMVPLLSIQQDLLHLRKKNISVSIIKPTHPNKWMLLHISDRMHVSRIYSLLFSHFFLLPHFSLVLYIQKVMRQFCTLYSLHFFITFSIHLMAAPAAYCAQYDMTTFVLRVPWTRDRCQTGIFSVFLTKPSLLLSLDISV